MALFAGTNGSLIGIVRAKAKVVEALLGAAALTCGLTMAGATPAAADGSVTLTVHGFADGAGTCDVGAGTCTTLRAAVGYADGANGTPVTVNLPPGEYTLSATSAEAPRLSHPVQSHETCDIPPSGSLNVICGADLTITGAGAGTTVIEGNGSALQAALMSISHDSDVHLSQVTLDSGSGANTGNGLGGDIYNNGTLTVTDATVSNGVGLCGGGIFNDTAGTVTLDTGTVLSGNVAQKSDSECPVTNVGTGGALYNAGHAELTGATIAGNSAYNEGGGIYSSGTLTISAGTTIVGNSAYQVGGGGIYSDSGGSLSVTGATIEGNSQGNGAEVGLGGGIYNASTQVVIDSSTITGNSVEGDGGGLYNSGSTTTITSTTISGNSASGAATNAGGGGGIFNAGAVTIDAVTLSGNNAGGGQFGGGVYNSGTLSVTPETSSSTITGNTAAEGGGVYAAPGSTNTFTSATLSGNSASQAGGGLSIAGGEPGATATVDSSTFSGNAVGSLGGALYNNGSLTLTNSTLSQNSTLQSDASALYNDSSGTATLNFDTLADNPGPVEAATIDNANSKASVTLGSSILAYAPGLQCSGNLVTSTGDNVVSDTSCSFGEADLQPADPALLPLSSNGGPTQTMAISTVLSPAIPATDNTNEGSCSPATDQRGLGRPTTINGHPGCDSGAYQLQGVPQVATGSGTGAQTFTIALHGDTDTPDAGNCTTGAPGFCPTIRDAVAYANANAGTTVAVDLSSGEYVISGTPLDLTAGNLTLSGPGLSQTVIEVGGTLDGQILTIQSDATATLSGLTLDGGTGSQGGDVGNDGTLTLAGAALTGGSGNHGGGGVYNHGTLTLATGSQVSGNSAPGSHGGGIYNDSSGTVTIGASPQTGVVISGNSAPSGGGLYNNNSAMLGSGATFNGNSAPSDGGGAIFNDFNGVLGATGTVLTGNSAMTDGGGIWNDSNTTGSGPLDGVTGITLSGVTISGSSAERYDGGAVYNNLVDPPTVTITDSTLSGNSAGRSGGGVWNSGTASISGSTLSFDSAGGTGIAGGGGAYNTFGGSLTVTGSTVNGSSAPAGWGGGISDYSGITSISDSTISNSSAKSEGGGLYIGKSGPNATTDVSGSTFAGNSAPDGGGGGIYNDAQLTIENSTLTGNTTAKGSGNESGTGTAVYNTNSGQATLSFVTLAGNAGPSGGAASIYNSSASLTLVSSALAYAPGRGCTGGTAVTSGGGNVAMDASCSPTEGDLPTGDPLLLPLASNGGSTQTMAIASASSAAVPTVDNTTAGKCLDAAESQVTEDQRGSARPTMFNGVNGCDAGAYQLQPQAPPPPPAAGPVSSPTPPTVTAVSPAFGPPAGGNTVAITGTGFSTAQGGTVFDFGSNAATNVSCSSSTSCNVTAPAGALGSVDVTATVGGLTSATNPGDVYTYELSQQQIVCSTNQETRFVCQAYLDMQGRTVDPQGVLTWANGLIAGTLTRPQVVLGIDQSIEYRTNLIQSWFRAYLNRPADPGAVITFLTALESGFTEEQVQSLILGSPEYFADTGGTNGEFLSKLYQQVLDRPIDPVGSAYWGAALSHLSRQEVALMLLSSQEYESQLVSTWYERFLHRAVDPGSLAAWINAMSHGMSDGVVLSGIVGSDEYFSHV